MKETYDSSESKPPLHEFLDFISLEDMDLAVHPHVSSKLTLDGALGDPLPDEWSGSCQVPWCDVCNAYCASFLLGLKAGGT